MATGWNVMDALNKRTKATVEDNTPRARFRTKDISIKRMYTNDRNFYSMQDIKSLAQEIYAVGLLENMTVVYDPCERGEYRIIAGERRWRALTLLVSQGHTEFEVASCQIKTPAGTHEEIVQLIIANAYRDKTAADILEEERQLKESLQYMKDNGLTLQGYDLNSGRLRDVIADMLKMSTGKIAQIESINKHLIPEFSEELKAGRLTFSAAYEISGMPEDMQQEMLNRYKESGAVMLWKEVKAEKKSSRKNRKSSRTKRTMTRRHRIPKRMTAKRRKKMTMPTLTQTMKILKNRSHGKRRTQSMLNRYATDAVGTMNALRGHGAC